MSAAPEKIRLDPEHPYPGPSSFDEEHAAFFHGRSREGEELFSLVELRPITVLYGKSGLGKTSLLQAGLFPRLRRAGVVPLRIRLGFGVDEEGARHPPLRDQIKNRLREATARGELDGEPPREGETLWEYFHWTGFWDEAGRPAVPLLVLDQFEEVFTLGRDRADELRALMRELSDLVENRIPAEVREAAQEGKVDLPPSYEAVGAKVLIALREEFLAQLDDHRPQMPSLGAGRYRLRPLDGPAARDAVFEPGRAVVTEDVAARIVRKLGSVADDAPLASIEEVEPALLALYCHELNALRDRNKLPKIDGALLQASEEEILDQFYERCLRGMPGPVRLLVEEKLLTPDNRRDTIAIGRVGAEGVTEAEVRKLVDRRLLRKEPRLGHEYVEIVHDKLIRTIAGKRDERRRREREIAERERIAEEQREREGALRARAEEARRGAEVERERREAAARENKLLLGLVLLLALVAIGLPSYVIYSNNEKAQAALQSRNAEHIQSNFRQRETFTDLAWRAAADERWDDTARLLAPTFLGLADSQKLAPSLSKRADPKMLEAQPLLGLLASRFEAYAGHVHTVPDASGNGSIAVSRDGRVAAELGSDGRTVTLLDLTHDDEPEVADPPGDPDAAPSKEDAGSAASVTSSFAGRLQQITVSDDGERVFGVSEGGYLVAWRAAGGERAIGVRTSLAKPRLSVDAKGSLAVLWDRDADRALFLGFDQQGAGLDGVIDLSLRSIEAPPPPDAGRFRYVGEWRAIVPAPDGGCVIGLHEDVWLRREGHADQLTSTRVQRWDPALGQSLGDVSIQGRVLRAAFSQDGALLATVTDAGAVWILAVDGAAPPRKLPVEVRSDAWFGFAGDEQAVYVVADGALSIWDVGGKAPPRQRLEVNLGGAPRDLSLSADARRAVVWINDEVRLVDLAVGQPRASVVLTEAELRGAVALRAVGDAALVITARDPVARVRRLGGSDPELDRTLWGRAASAKATYSTQLPRAGVVEDVAFDNNLLALLVDGGLTLAHPRADALDFTTIKAGSLDRLDPSSPGDASTIRAVRLASGRIAALDGAGALRFGETRFATLRRAHDDTEGGNLLALSGDGEWAATARGASLHVWEADTGRRVWTGNMARLDGATSTNQATVVTAIAVTDDARDKPRAVAGDARGSLLMVRGAPAVSRTPSRRKSLAWSTAPFGPSPHTDAVRVIELGPGGRIATGADDGTIALWERDGRVAWTAALTGAENVGVRVLRFADEGRLLVSGGADGRVSVWRMSDGEAVCAVTHTGAVTDISTDRVLAASVDAGGVGVVWRLATCEVVRSLRGMAYVGFSAGAHDRVIAVRRSGRAELWPTTTGGVEARAAEPRGTAPWGVTAGRSTLVTADEEGSLFSWKLDDAHPLPEALAGDLGGPPAVASAAGRAVAVTADGVMRAFGDATVPPALPIHLAVDPGWAVRAVAVASGDARVFTVEEGEGGAIRARTFAWGTWAPSAPVELRGGKRCAASPAIAGARTFAAGAAGGIFRAAVADVSGCVRVWDEAGALLVEGPAADGSADTSARISALAIDPRSSRLLLATADGAVWIWATDPAPGESTPSLRRLALDRRRHTGRVRAVAFHPTLDFAVTAGDDGQAWLWDTSTGRSLARLGAHPAPIHWAAFQPDGEAVITGGADGWIRTWSTRTRARDHEAVLRTLGAWLPELSPSPAAP